MIRDRLQIETWKRLICLIPNGRAGVPAKKAENEDAKETIFDETLKCAMCMDLCSRPITVSPIMLCYSVVMTCCMGYEGLSKPSAQEINPGLVTTSRL